MESLHAARVRREIEVGPIRPPQRLAPYSYAVGAEVRPPDDPDIVPTDSQGTAFGRLILLYDPAGQEAWNGTIRLVAYLQAEVEAALAMDPLLPEVAWSWLSDALGVPVGESSTPSTPPTARPRTAPPTASRSPRSAAPSPRPRRSATATSPGRRAPTSSRSGRRGLR
ncbi:Protein of unknown function [Gordonia westfalica]|uniref:DUF3000 domain-containing protein n=1 Tax=Gordonia westfalica TaxID=158898 RepID=A0A1H2HSM7_9ACTN|nr:Protein of unknown function [Gordonia westfalica]